MTITESNRKKLYDRLEQTLGPEEATTLMEHLPPVGWADVARQSDVLILRGDIDRVRDDLGYFRTDVIRMFGDVDHKFGDVDHKFGGVAGKFDDVSRRFDEVDRKFDDVSRRFDEVDHKFDDVSRRFDEVDRKFEEMDERNRLRLDSMADRLRTEIMRELRTYGLALIAINATLTGLAATVGRL